MPDPHPMSTTLLALAVAGVVVSMILYLVSIAASIAVARSKRAVLNSMVDEEYSGSTRAVLIVDRAEQYLLCTQFGRVVSSIASGFLIAVAAYEFIRCFQVSGQPGWLYTWAIIAGALYLSLVALLLVAVQVVKSVTFEMPEKVLCYTASFLAMFAAICGPVLSFAESLIGKVLKQWGIEASHEREVRISAAELGEIVKMSSEAGVLKEDDGHILEGVAELSERIARDVMTPRAEIVWVKRSCSTRQVIDLCRMESVSRLLVCGAELDDVSGVLLSKDLLAFAGEVVEDESWKKFIRPAFRVPDTKIVKELLLELQQRRVHFSVVLNEHGEVVGVVTLEDLVEEIVGEIFDEFDNPYREAPIILEEAGVLYLDGTVPFEILAERLHARIPESDSQTVSGFISEQLGRLPNSGDCFSVQGVTFTVLEVQKNKIKRLSVVECPDYQSDADDDIAVGGDLR
jgi:putative hemolysin